MQNLIFLRIQHSHLETVVRVAAVLAIVSFIMRTTPAVLDVAYQFPSPGITLAVAYNWMIACVAMSVLLAQRPWLSPIRHNRARFKPLVLVAVLAVISSHVLIGVTTGPALAEYTTREIWSSIASQWLAATMGMSVLSLLAWHSLFRTLHAPPTPTTIGFDYHDGGRAPAGHRWAAGDCVSRSLAIQTATPYQQVYSDLQQAQHNYRGSTKISEGMAPDAYREAYESYGLHMATLERNTHITYTDAYRKYGNCIVATPGHVATIKDGILFDTVDPRRLRRDGTEKEQRIEAVWVSYPALKDEACKSLS